MHDREIELLIRSLGIYATYRGYRYLCYGIKLRLEDEDYLLCISKLLYPEIARVFHASSCSVERDIRTVIRVCWERGNTRLLHEIALHPLIGRPTAGEFLDILVSHIRHSCSIPVF